MNKKGTNWLGVSLVVLVFIAIAGAGFVGYKQGWFSDEAQQTVANTQVVQQAIETQKTGNIATIGVYVRDLSNNNINSKLAVPVYCVDESGSFIIDGTSSSTSAEITGKTAKNKVLTCYAFNATVQTKEPKVVTVDESFEHIVIDAYMIPTAGHIQVYNDQLVTGTGGTVNVTGVASDSTGTLQKLRVTNNQTDRVMPLGGVYFATVPSSNVSSIDISGGATLYGADHSSLSIVSSGLGNSVETRKDNWDFVFEIDDKPSDAGNQALLLEENDYFDTGTVSVLGGGNGCSNTEAITMYGFSKGYYRGTKSDTILYGHQTDASSGSVISLDWTGDNFYCRA